CITIKNLPPVPKRRNVILSISLHPLCGLLDASFCLRPLQQKTSEDIMTGASAAEDRSRNKKQRSKKPATRRGIVFGRSLRRQPQEVEVFKRIEQAEFEIKTLIYTLGFVAKEHIAVAGKLLSDPPRERFDRVVMESQSGSREKHLKALQRLIRTTRALDEKTDALY